MISEKELEIEFETWLIIILMNKLLIINKNVNYT